MKKLPLILCMLTSIPALAANQPQFRNLSKTDVKNVSKEFGANFSHTSVAAPETNGLWGVEVGLAGGTTSSPKFSDVIKNSGGEDSDFKTIYHAGLMARGHFPLELFAELTLLPEQDISDVEVKSQSVGVGWNAGGFFGLPLDLAIGADYSSGRIKFHQDAKTSPIVPAADIELETKTTNYWVGVSKTFVFFTPYFKTGLSKISGEINSSGSILSYQTSQSESVNLSGGYMALGANLQFFFIKFGIEGSQIQSVKRLSGKLSFDF